MEGFSWLNEAMQWLARWVPRLVLIQPEQAGIVFRPGGQVTVKQPGLCVYWPIIHEYQLVSLRRRTTEVAAQLHGREAVQIVIVYRVVDPATVAIMLHNPFAFLDDRAQAALAVAYGADRPSNEIGKSVCERLRWDLAVFGIDVERVDVSQRGPIIAVKMLQDWAHHEEASL